MSTEDTFGNLFKPEVKSSGRKLFAQEKVSLGTQSDTAIQAYIRVSPPFKVKFTTLDISSTTFSVECNCPVAKKNRYCKHVWATLLCVEENYPDFLSNKTDIESLNATIPASEPNIKLNIKTEKQTAYQEASKERANAYRKEQYQKQKARLKEKKQEQKGKGTTSVASYPVAVEAACAYFEQNGFPMNPPSNDIFLQAKRKLSRLFHPDKGGTHDEFVELNHHCEALQLYFKNE